jgi:GntR family transcriptional regulator
MSGVPDPKPLLDFGRLGSRHEPDRSLDPSVPITDRLDCTYSTINLDGLFDERMGGRSVAVSQAIERNSAVPYYQQLFEILRDRIMAGAISPDERLSSESEMCREFGLARATVRQTLSKLETEGFARRVARRGVFASAGPASRSSGWVVQDSQSFLESQLRHGRTGITTNVVDAQFVSPPQHVADALRVDPHEHAFALQRLRSLDGKVAMFSTNWFPHAVGQIIATADDVLQGAGSVSNALQKFGFVTHGAHRIIHAMRPAEPVSSYLRITADLPVLRVRSLSWDRGDVPFDYYETWVLTDVVPLEVNVVAG